MSSPQADLAKRCASYLRAGPPQHFTDYVPGSLTEIIIGHGAESIPLDAELREVAGLILGESSAAQFYDTAIRTYLEQGSSLVREVLAQQA